MCIYGQGLGLVKCVSMVKGWVGVKCVSVVKGWVGVKCVSVVKGWVELNVYLWSRVVLS